MDSNSAIIFGTKGFKLYYEFYLGQDKTSEAQDKITKVLCVKNVAKSSNDKAKRWITERKDLATEMNIMFGNCRKKKFFR